MNPVFKAAIGGIALAGAAGAAQAAEPVTFFGYILNASVSGQYAPTYEGGKHFTEFPGGSLAITKPWDFDAFTPPDDAASLGLLNTKHVQFGAAVSLRENRYNDDELQGMRSIGWALMGGGYMNIWPTHWIRIHVEGLKGLTSESGVVVNTGMDFVHHPKNWNLSIGPRYSWGDAKFNNTYFGVIPGEAAASPYIHTAYEPGAGSHYAGVEAMAEYKWRPRWRLTFNANYNRLLARDADSPLVRQIGTPNQYGVGAGLRFMLQD